MIHRIEQKSLEKNVAIQFCFMASDAHVEQQC